MNIRRGLWRLWVVFAWTWALVTFALAVRPVGNEFAAADHEAALEAVKWTPEVPVIIGPDDTLGNAYCRLDLPNHLCWASVSWFRSTHNVPTDMSDHDLVVAVYDQAGVPFYDPSPWWMIFKRFLLAIGVPLAVLIFGRSVQWAMDGFWSAPYLDDDEDEDDESFEDMVTE